MDALTTILTAKYWAFEAGFFHRIAPYVLHRLNEGRDIAPIAKAGEEPKQYEPAYHEGRIAKNYFFDYKNRFPFHTSYEGKKIHRLDMSGSLSKHGICGVGGYEQMKAQLSRADSKDDVLGHIIVGNTPGGTVDSTPDFSAFLKTLNKPNLVFADGMIASAGLWNAVHSPWIIANKNNYTEIGSIGVLLTRVDQRGWLKKEGYDVTIMRAEQSKDKALENPYEEWSKELVDQVQGELNQLADDFKQIIINMRGGRLKTGKEDIFTGKMYDKEKAKEMGLIDEIGTLEYAIEKVVSFATTSLGKATYKSLII